MITIRTANPADAAAIRSILRPVFRAGETYAISREIDEADAVAYWCGHKHETFVAEHGGDILGTYYLRENQAGGGNPWEAYGFQKVGCIALGFQHPTLGLVDAFVMHRQL